MRSRLVVRLLWPVVIVLLIFARYVVGISDVKFHGDESDWIATSVVYEELLGGQFDSPSWEESYWTLTQPPLARYVIGLGRTIGGFGLASLHRSFYDWGLTYEQNEAAGAVPSARLLWWSRLPMALLAIISFVFGLALIRRTSGWTGCLAWAALVACNPYLARHLRRAMGEAPLLASVAAAAFASCMTMRFAVGWSGRRPRGSALWCGLLGATIGLAGASKLNGLSLSVAGLSTAALVAWKTRTGARSGARFWVCGALLTTIAVLTFVGLNPYLWPAPATRSWRMLDHRLTEMASAVAGFPLARARLGSSYERPFRVASRVFSDHASLSGGPAVWINAVAFSTGLLSVLHRSWQGVRSGLISPASTAILLVGAAAAIPALFTPLDWPRYFLVPVFFSTMLIAIGAGSCATWALRVAGAAERRRRGEALE